ncbi:GDSL esterase/lipase, partial [Cucurbita argyrosperma subsp. sororia]
MESHSLMFAVLALSLTPCSVLARKPCNFPAIFNFGDSNSDTGGFSAVFGQAPPPNGMSYFHGPVGRYSDGRLIVDFIAESLGLPYLSAYLNGLGANYSHGANLRRLPQLLGNQTKLFVWVAGYFANMSVEQVRGYIPQVLEQFTTIVKSVHGQGGRFFWIHNTGPVGCLPYVLVGMHVSPSDYDQYGCAIPFNDLAQEFNRGLKEAVVELRTALPDAVITYVDIYSLKYAIVSQHKKHGFEFPLRTCCGHGGKYNFNLKLGCGGTKRIHGKDVLIGKACKRPGVYVNWDGVHYTQAANKWIFNQIKTGAFSDPPTPLKMACHRI